MPQFITDVEGGAVNVAHVTRLRKTRAHVIVADLVGRANAIALTTAYANGAQAADALTRLIEQIGGEVEVS